MGGLLRRRSANTKRLIKAALRSVGPSPELVVDLERLRNQVQLNAGRIDDLARRVDSLTSAVASLRTAREEILAEHNAVPELSGTVVGIGERVHIHEQELKEIRREVERFGGSVLDDMAVERRLRNIEDRLGSSESTGTEPAETAPDGPEA